jgi:hypothetical protein
VAKVTRLRPKRHDEIRERLQLALDLPLDLKQETRDDLTNALGRYSPPKGWPFFMLNPDQLRFVNRAIRQGPRPHSTLEVWNAAMTYIRYDAGETVEIREIMASRALLAKDADLSPDETSRALAQLAKIGVLVRLRRGRYGVNPHVGFCGSLIKREAASKKVPPLKLIKRDGAP